MSEFDNPTEAQREPELMIARRAFPVTQALFAGGVLRVALGAAAVTWHGENEHPEGGATALVAEGSDLVGEVVQVTRAAPVAPRIVRVYVVGTADMDDADLSLARRPFLALGLLALETITAKVEVLDIDLEAA